MVEILNILPRGEKIKIHESGILTPEENIV